MIAWDCWVNMDGLIPVSDVACFSHSYGPSFLFRPWQKWLCGVVSMLFMEKLFVASNLSRPYLGEQTIINIYGLRVLLTPVFADWHLYFKFLWSQKVSKAQIKFLSIQIPHELCVSSTWMATTVTRAEVYIVPLLPYVCISLSLVIPVWHPSANSWSQRPISY